MKSRAVASLLYLTAQFAGDQAFGDVVVCPPADHYEGGVKATMYLAVPNGGADALTAAIKAYGMKHDLSYWQVDLRERPDVPISKVTRGLQNSSFRVSVVVQTGPIKDVAYVQIATPLCGPQEDWRPYWHDFEAFISASQYRCLPN